MRWAPIRLRDGRQCRIVYIILWMWRAVRYWRIGPAMCWLPEVGIGAPLCGPVAKGRQSQVSSLWLPVCCGSRKRWSRSTTDLGCPLR